MHPTLEIPKDHPLLAGVKPGGKFEALVSFRYPEDEEEDDDACACEVLKIDGVATDDMDSDDGESDMELEATDDGQGEPTFTALMFGKKKAKRSDDSDSEY